MKLIIEIPKEFEEHFNKDKFSDSLARVASDIESFGVPLSGRYEQETITMIRKAFEQATPLEAQPTDITWVVGNDGAKVAFKDMPVDKVQKICAIIGDKAQPTDAVSREEALLALTGMDLPTDRDKLIALFTDRIQHLPPVQPQTNYERPVFCIDRREAIKTIHNIKGYKALDGSDMIKRDALLDEFALLHSVQPQRKKGKWITWKEAGNYIPSETRFECSVCHDAAQTLCNGLDLLSPYCPNCGAKMEVSAE